MKPGDHPEFFRLPPPEGRSRESSIVLTRDGRFLHDGSPVEHPGMRRAFASWLARHPDDGRYILNNGYDWTYLTVEGAARFVADVTAEATLGSGPQNAGDRPPPQLTLLDGQSLPLDPSALSADPEGRLWLRLPDGELACFTAPAQLAMAPWLTEQAGEVGVEICGVFSAIAGARVG